MSPSELRDVSMLQNSTLPMTIDYSNLKKENANPENKMDAL